MGLNEQQLRVMQHISKGGQVRLGDLTKVFTLPKRTLQRALQELTKRGLLIKHGTGKSTWYETTK
jgi:DeoR/GlpR family transcriptional regulator of sugar metabolism